MRIRFSRAAWGVALVVAAVLATPAVSAGQAVSYLDFDAFTRELRAVTGASNLATMESLGTTLGGRDVWMVRVGDPSGAPLDERPGLLVVGNLEGDHVVGSQLILEAIRYLLNNAGNETVKTALSDRVFYFFPRLNPDGAEAMFAAVKTNRRTNSRSRDDDNDGRTDEDGPEDLNGDGYITVMRVPDPAGRYMIDPADARAMKRADPSKGESGQFTLYWEGTDNDGDGFINEDGTGGVDLNRNFQHAYPYWKADAGPYMVSEVETRALMDFTLAHQNIAAIVTFGETDNLVTPPDARGALAGAKVAALPGFADASNAGVFAKGVVSSGGSTGRRGGGGGRGGGSSYLRGAQPGRDNDPSSGDRPAMTVAPQDLVYFRAVSDAYKRITGIETVPMNRPAEGAFFQYGYFQFGVPSFSTVGWGLPSTTASQPRGRGEPRGGAGAPGASGESATDASLIADLEAAGIAPFSDWRSYRHPDLGDVEIGGFLPYVIQNPPADQLPDLGRKHGEFLAELAGMLPKVRIAGTEVKALGGGVFAVTVEVENVGFLPTSLRHGQTSRSVGPTFLQIQVDDKSILSGAAKTASVGVLAGSGTRDEVTWVIRGQAGATVEIKLHSQKSGRGTATVTLK